MAKEVIMPVFGFTQEESEIVEWLVQEGELVEEGDPLLEVTTDKVNMEVEAPATGILAGIRYPAGATVAVTEIIAYILAPGEILPSKGASPSAATSLDNERMYSSPTLTTSSATPVATRLAQEQGVNLTLVSGSGPSGRIRRQDVERYLAADGDDLHEAEVDKVRATPAARRQSRERSIPLVTVPGSGPNGRIQEQDVLRAAEQQLQKVTSQAAEAPLAGPVTAGVTRIQFNNMRRTIARNMQRNMQEAPHITFRVDLGMQAVLDLVERANARLAREGLKITVTAVLAKAVAWALQQHPLLNSHMADDALLQFEKINLGIAVALPDGLIVPVVHDVVSKNVAQLAETIKDLAMRAGQGKLKPAELTGGTFTISNLGMYHVDSFTAILNSPQVGILAIGRTNDRFVPDDLGRPVLRPISTMTLSVDHRAIDGAVAARFLEDLRTVVEHPEMMSV